MGSHITLGAGTWVLVHKFGKSADKMHADICFAIMEIRNSGTEPMDIRPENLGMNDKGNFGLFDQKQKNVIAEFEFKEYIIDKSIKEKQEAILEKRPELAISHEHDASMSY